jgi:retron-type reverse transcriptase
MERNLLQLQRELCDQTYRPGPYHNFYIYEPKLRLVSAVPFRDRVVHHALCQVIEPIWEPRFIHTSFACRRGNGTHKALDQCQAWARQYRYVFHGDIVKYFPSIDHRIMRSLLARRIADRQVMWLIDQILDSGAGIQASEYPPIYFSGDDLFTALRPRGLPIGNLTSQFWANVYLHELDKLVKHRLRCPAYLRYMDDSVLFYDDKAQLHNNRNNNIGFRCAGVAPGELLKSQVRLVHGRGASAEREKSRSVPGWASHSYGGSTKDKPAPLCVVGPDGS